MSYEVLAVIHMSAKMQNDIALRTVEIWTTISAMNLEYELCGVQTGQNEVWVTRQQAQTFYLS